MTVRHKSYDLSNILPSSSATEPRSKRRSRRRAVTPHLMRPPRKGNDMSWSNIRVQKDGDRVTLEYDYIDNVDQSTEAIKRTFYLRGNQVYEESPKGNKHDFQLCAHGRTGMTCAINSDSTDKQEALFRLIKKEFSA